MSSSRHTSYRSTSIRALYVVVIGLLAASVACRPSVPAANRQVFHLNISTGYLESLDPAYAKDLNMMWIHHMLYNTLVETDEHLRTVPSLARSWEVSPDGLLYTFHLRTGVFFHDNPVFPGGKGRKMVAADVVFSFSRLIDPATASPGAWIFNGRVAALHPFSAVDDSTFTIALSQPFRPLVPMLSMPYCNIVPREVCTRWGKDFRSHPCGTGPFVFHFWDEGNALVLLRNPHYWEHDTLGKPLPYLDAVQVSFIDSKASEFLLFLQGKVDFVNGIDGASKDIILSKDGNLRPAFTYRFNIDKSTYLNTEYIGFLCDTNALIMAGEPTRDYLVRQAINYAIDRQKIVTYFKNGVGIPATHGFIPAGMPGYDSASAYGYHYDPAMAAALLKRAGHEHGRGLKPIKVMVPNNYEDIVNFIASEVQETGIKLEIELIQANVLKQQMSASKAVMFRAQWFADYPDAETYMVCFNSRFPAPPNYSGFRNPVFDSLYDRALNLPDTARWAMYRKMDSLAMAYAPVIPLFYEKQVHLTQSNISGLHTNPMNLIDLTRVVKK